MANALFEIRMKVSRGDGCDMPAGISGAFVACYSSAPDYQARRLEEEKREKREKASA